MLLLGLLPTLILLLLFAATVSLFVFFKGTPTRRKRTIAKWAIGYLFALNALLASVLNIALFTGQDIEGVTIHSVTMLVIPLLLGFFLYRGGVRRQGGSTADGEDTAQQEVPRGAEPVGAETVGTEASGTETVARDADESKEAEEGAASEGSLTKQGQIHDISKGLWALLVISLVFYVPVIIALS